MAERFDIGGAAYHLSIDSARFDAGLNKALADAQAANQKIAAALSGVGRGAGGSGGVAIAVKADVTQATTALNGIQQRARELQAANRITLAIRADGGQAEAEIRQVQQALAAAQRRDRVTIQLRADATQAQQTMGRLEAEIRAAERRGAKITVNVDTRNAEAQLGRLQQLAAAASRGVIQGSGIGSGFLLGAGAGVGAIASLGVATAVSQLTEAITGSISAGIRYNSTFEQINNTLLHFTGSAEAAQQALAGFRKLDIESPFTEQQVQGAGTSFIRVAQGDIQRAQELTEITTQLAAARPAQPFEDMHAAVLQLVSGDFTAFEDRAGVAFGTVRRLVEQGVTGMELYRRAVQAAGASPELFAKNADTFQARLSTLQSNIQKFQGHVTKGGFDALSGDIDALNKSVEQNATGWAKAAEEVGAFAAEAFKFSGMGLTISAVSQLAAFRAAQLQPAPDSPAGIAAAVTSPDQLARQAITAQRDAAKEIEAQLKLNADAAAKVKAEYEQSIAPLQRQLDLINQPNFDIQRRQAQIQFSQAGAARLGERALGPVEIRADVAGQRAVLSLEREAIEIRQRRATLAEQIGQAEQSIARRTAEEQIRAAEEGARAQQAGAQERQQARQDEISALQEDVRIRRQGVQDEQSGIQEVIRIRRQGVDDALAGERQVSEAARQRFADAERGYDRIHQRSQEVYRDEISALQEINRVANERARTPSASERALAALDARERRFQAARTLAEARSAVRNSDTPDERRAAKRRLEEVKHEQAVARRREQLELRIKAEREAEEKARLAREEQIRQLEAKARAEDRAFQKEKEIRAEQERQADRKAAEQLRVDERAEKIKQRQEDDAARAAERTERAKQREEDSAIRALEQADREAARADQQQIAASLKAVADSRAALQAGADSAGLAGDQANLDRLRELAANESQELDLRQKLLDEQDAFLAASAARAKVIADSAATLVGIEAAQDAAVKELASISILEQLSTFKVDFAAALAPIEKNTRDLEQRLRDTNAAILEAEARLKALQAPQAPPGGQEPNQAQGGISLPFNLSLPSPDQIAAGASQIAQNLAGALGVPNVTGPLSVASQALAKAISAGVAAFLADDSQTPIDVKAWVDDAIIKTAKDALGIASPSTVFEAMAREIPPGFVQGLEGSESTIGQAMVAVFDAAWANYLARWFTGGDGLQTQLGVHFGNAAAGLNSEATHAAFGTAMFNALQGGYEASVLPFFTAEDGLGAQLGTHFATAAGQLNSATTQRAIGESMRDALTAGLNISVSRQQEWWRIFEQLGENLAISMANGYIRYSSANPLPAPSAGGGGAPASAAAGAQGGPTGQRFGQNDAQTYLIGKGYVPGTADFNEQFDRLFAYQSQGYLPPPDMTVTGHINGGWLTEPTWLVNARTGRIYGSAVEDGRPERILSHGASIRTASTLDFSGLRASPVSRPSGGARGGPTSVTINVNGYGRDAKSIIAEAERRIVNLFDTVERNAPDPAPPTLGGA